MVSHRLGGAGVGGGRASPSTGGDENKTKKKEEKEKKKKRDASRHPLTLSRKIRFSKDRRLEMREIRF